MNPLRSTVRLAIVCDLVEERWPSMDLVAEMLLAELQANHADRVEPRRLLPAMRRRFSGKDSTGGLRLAIDRLLARFHDYPRYLRAERTSHDVFHIVDHSYSQLVHSVPTGRAVVTCHDLDTFRSVLEPAISPRSAIFRVMTRRILEGFTRAAHVACDTGATRDEILHHGLLSPDRVSVVPLGIHPTCHPFPDPEGDAAINVLLGVPTLAGREILHVGSTIPRKRIDVLLRVFAAVAGSRDDLRLVRAGGSLGPQQRALARELNIEAKIVELPFLPRRTLGALYRRAAVVLLPSDGEGFGLPVVEAMACATPVVASDLAVLREVGGDAAVYAPAGDVRAWSATIDGLLDERETRPDQWKARQSRGVARAASFTWAAYASRMTEIYQRVAAR